MNPSLPPPALPSWIERMGIGTATLCVLHCLAAPALFTLAGLGSPLAEAAEMPLLLFSFLFAGYTFCSGVQLHGRRRLLLLPLAAAMLVASGWGIAAHYERMCVAGGAILLATGHWLNHRLCRLCTHGAERREAYGKC